MVRFFATDTSSQREYWSSADQSHYAWQTEAGYFAETERALLARAGIPEGGRLLEIGCGEGGNLHHLGARPGWAGIDFAPRKLHHARSTLAGLVFAQADAARLPLRDETFDAVLIRDLLHHVPDRLAVLAEAMRVLRLGGVVAVIEPNRGSPLILAQALLVRAERAVLVSHAARMGDELRNVGFREVTVARAQPFPAARLFTHPRLGLARLGRSPAVRSLLVTVEKLAARVVPAAAWMYLVGRGRKG
jgi:SAM-dependent methyltransferase